MPRHRVARAVAAISLLLAGAAGACGDGDDDAALGEQRAEQVREVALEAGLPEDVADVLASAARGTTATFRVTYAGSGGASVVLSQDPPMSRLDVVVGEAIVESHVVRDGVSYRCEPESSPAPDAALRCERERAAVERPGALDERALAEFAEDLAGSEERFDLSVEERTIAGTTATCLTTAPVAGTPIDGSGPGADTLCVSPEGAPLLTDVGGERLVAEAYSTEVPEGTFEV